MWAGTGCSLFLANKILRGTIIKPGIKELEEEKVLIPASYCVSSLQPLAPIKISGGNMYTNEAILSFSGTVEEENNMLLCNPNIIDHQTRTFLRMVHMNVCNIFLKPPFFLFSSSFFIISCSILCICIFSACL